MVDLLIKYNQQKFYWCSQIEEEKILCTKNGQILSFSKDFNRTKLHKKVPRYIFFLLSKVIAIFR